MYSMALFLHFGSSFLRRMVRRVERNKGCSICNKSSPSFSLGKTKDSNQNDNKEVVSTSATHIPIMTFCAVVINLSHHQNHVLAPVLPSGHLE